ncbi:30S ribosome-binding factor RbfA [Coxiella endosymbiont of Amblyomma sculptum]|uniref:30S ribosome-binding factor RbfA n=1 Tax=Coxiella endosymbiont of Amblyomma sculptum TaxID=2487929 RepID=UPI00132E8309|nr:30S ribosome-binding factor RbfA [Coxiella endosymbiont of Amblyomma sculptum]QHG92678.1 30S ribosome-binding factor RbfA [Coxiella endosymbiont of Amblyomma sculptum]
MLSHRKQRVAGLVRRQLSELLKKEVHDPRLSLISVTDAFVSSDLRQAKVFYTLLLPEDHNLQEIQEVLNKATGYLRHLLARSTILRYAPDLVFYYDNSIEKADRIRRLLN